jgi:hypothetical protein
MARLVRLFWEKESGDRDRQAVAGQKEEHKTGYAGRALGMVGTEPDLCCGTRSSGKRGFVASYLGVSLALPGKNRKTRIGPVYVRAACLVNQGTAKTAP